MLFFILTASLILLAIDPTQQYWGASRPVIIRAYALLATLLPLDRQFGADLGNQSPDELLLCGLPASAIGAAKTWRIGSPQGRHSC
jgi:heme exporter protein B